jgi:hypothetical protein
MCWIVTGTANLSLLFDGNSGKCMVQGYADADCGGDLNTTRRSTTGYIFHVHGGTVAWNTQLQSTVALSTTETKYMAFASAARQATWLQLLLDDLQLSFPAG